LIGTLANIGIASEIDWRSLPDLPDELGVAGPFVGVHNDVLIVAGGANFGRPVWESPKQWHDAIHVLVKTDTGYQWKSGGKLSRKIGYGTSVSTNGGVLCIGGNDAETTFQTVFLLAWSPAEETIEILDMPDLPTPLAYAQAAIIGSKVYVAGGQTDLGIESATNHLYVIDLSQKELTWQRLQDIPGPNRAFHLTVAQHNGFDDCVYVISGRGLVDGKIKFLTDVWEYNTRTGQFRARSDVPRCVMAGTAVAIGQSHLWVPSGDDGALFFQTEALKDDHPGFPRDILAYHTITDTWATVGEAPANQVTTTAVWWNDTITIASGETRPRVRTPAVWAISPQPHVRSFGTLNYIVLCGYLSAMVGVGIYFAWRNKNTDDYFRGGKQIPWWAAGCSIFATMLSSLTFTGIPSKAFAQDWVYAIGNLMIPLVAVIAIMVALPFYRRLDVTSAYEYLELRFSPTVRRFGSLCFSLFHTFRMGVVMSLTGYAIAVATPLTPAQAVLLMGLLSIIYCTLGGIEAVIWTDTLQTFVLLGGAIFALSMLVAGTDGGCSGAIDAAISHDKFRIAHFHTDITSAQLALWVVVIGAIGQNVSSYTADQAVVQRYMTTATDRLAARSIATNAVMTIPATLLFFGIGTALFSYYRSHPTRLDPTITTDQIFPYFIASQVPAGIAGLIVAGIFAAAQSTVSTSMNSTATTFITDIVKPLGICRTDAAYLAFARVTTLVVGILGTMLGIMFIDPSIRSLFDAFIKVIGLFMGVLGGLFVLGVSTRRATARGAVIGVVAGSLSMVYLWLFTSVNGYIYTACGIAACVAIGYLASLVTGPQTKDLTGLTLRSGIDGRGQH
jgi:SSS family solute:Na+ symporter